MSECDVVRERMPQLLVEAVEPMLREVSHQHVESCEGCGREWESMRAAWLALADIPELPVPAAVRERFLAEAARLSGEEKVVAFPVRRHWRWIAQAAAVVVLVGGGWFGGQQSAHRRPATIEPPIVALSENVTIDAARVNPSFLGRPAVQNVRFTPVGTDRVELSFDVTSHVTVAGRPDDAAVISLLSHVVENNQAATLARSSAIDWIEDIYRQRGSASPELIKAVANVLATDAQEGVRLRAVDALTRLSGLAPEVQLALVDALKNDPNPGVRMKAIEALANLVKSGTGLDPAAIDTLRDKAVQDDENLYVRVKAAETLSQIDL